MCGTEAISTAALLDLIGLPATTGNARRMSKTMQSLGYVGQECAGGSRQPHQRLAHADARAFPHARRTARSRPARTR